MKLNFYNDIDFMKVVIMEEYTSDISVIDVYEIASAIGKEFEKIIIFTVIHFPDFV